MAAATAARSAAVAATRVSDAVAAAVDPCAAPRTQRQGTRAAAASTSLNVAQSGLAQDRMFGVGQASPCGGEGGGVWSQPPCYASRYVSCYASPIARPRTYDDGSGPQKCESRESARLSPSTKR